MLIIVRDAIESLVAGMSSFWRVVPVWVLDDACHVFEWHQPLGFDSLTLRGHSDFVILIDNTEAPDTINPTGVVQYPAKPRVIFGALAFPNSGLAAKHFRVHDVTAPVDLLQR